MSLEDEIYRGFTGRDRRHDETWRDLVHDFQAEKGSGRAAARAAGVPPSTWRRLVKGETRNPKPATLARVTRGVRAARIVNDVRQDTFTMHAKDPRAIHLTRKITARQLQLAPGTIDRVREAYLAGDDRGAAAVFIAGIGDPWYRQWLTPRSSVAQTGEMDDEDAERLGKDAATGAGDEDEDEDEGEEEDEEYEEYYDYEELIEDLSYADLHPDDDPYRAVVTGWGS
ncbi:MAG: hypothetical protein ACRDJW_11320 [Thermomicrobiales bacterium]